MKWTKSDENILQKLREEGRSIRDIASTVGKSFNSVEHKIRAMKLGLLPKQEKEIITASKITDRLKIIRELGEAFVETIQKHPVKIPKISYIEKNITDKREEKSILDLSDIHSGVVNRVFDTELQKEIITYNYDIMSKEFDKLTQSIFEIHSLLSHAYNLKDLYINVIGDIVTNDRIFEGQMFNIDRCVGKQIWDTVALLTTFVNNMKKIYKNVYLTCVVGNHGRSMEQFGDEPVQNNFEYHMYKVLNLIYKNDERVSVHVSENYNAIVNIAGHKHLLMHGDSFRGTGKNMATKVEKLYVNVGGFEVLDMGHFHTCREEEISDKVIVKYNGAWIPKEEYAYKKFRKYSIPKQWFYGCNKKRPETWAYKLDLRT